MYKITFVILHYLTYEDTKECINSILDNIDYENYSIIVVDNASPNDSIKLIKSEYCNNFKIHVIENKKNLGFAKGNNIGYKYAKDKLKSDFIILINNDMILNQKDFVDKIIEEYKTDKFHVLGPDIISIKDKQHQNPHKIKGITKKELKSLMFKFRIKLIINYIGIEDFIYYIKRKVSKGYQLQKVNFDKKLDDIQLQGSCLVFSPLYVQKLDGLYDKTFMYMEEDILYYLCKKNNMKMVYRPEIIIYHKEDSSTDATFNKSKQKKRFYYKNSLNSAVELSKLLNSDNNLDNYFI
jgi:GT2 family glycosyltransferase